MLERIVMYKLCKRSKG